jgi:hypothetical protein
LAQKTKITGFNDFQKEFIKWAVNKRQWLLRAAPGKGKSLATFGLYLLLRKQMGFGKMLVVTRAKSFVAFEEANVKKMLLLKLAKESDMSVLYSGYSWPADIYLISDFLLSKVVLKGSVDQKRALTELLSHVNLLVVDEAHSLRVHDSARTKSFRKVSVYFHKLMARDPMRHRIGFLTATPLYKNLENYHSIFSCLCVPNPLGSWFQFLDRFCVVEQMVSFGNRRMHTINGSHSYKDQIGYTKVTGYKNVGELNSLINPYIFSWDQSDFKFSFNLHYYGLSASEWDEYQKNIKGLGLDKTYAIDMEVGGVRQWVYRNKSDEFFMPGRKLVLTGNLVSGMRLMFNGEEALVRGVFSRDVDASYAVRAVKAQQCNSKAEQKLALLVDLIKSKPVGVLVYFNFLESVDAAYKRLCQEFPGRRIVQLTGKTKMFNLVASSLGVNDIVLMSSVASQSLDMYIPRLIVMECFGLTPGKAQQLCGRMTRENATFRDVSVDFILREGENVESYFYEKLRLRLRHVHVSEYLNADSLPVSECLKNMPPDLIDEAYLKEKLLWSSA